MKKIITLVFTFIALISLSACGSPDELYGYWKSEKNVEFLSGRAVVLTINEGTFSVGSQKFQDVTFEKKGDLWITDELTKILGVSISYSFKVIDNNTIEAFENNDKKIIDKGKFIRITKEEAEKIANYSGWDEIKSKSSPF